MKRQKEYYFKIGIFRFYITIEPDDVFPFVEFAVAMETKKFRSKIRRLKKSIHAG